MQQGLTDELYQHVHQYYDHPDFTPRERMAAEFAEQFAIDHRGVDVETAVAEQLQPVAQVDVFEVAEVPLIEAADLAEKIKKQSEALAKKAGEEVREHPIAAAAVAAAAVGLLGYAITHTRKPN